MHFLSLFASQTRAFSVKCRGLKVHNTSPHTVLGYKEETADRGRRISTLADSRASLVRRRSVYSGLFWKAFISFRFRSSRPICLLRPSRYSSYTRQSRQCLTFLLLFCFRCAADHNSISARGVNLLGKGRLAERAVIAGYKYCNEYDV